MATAAALHEAIGPSAVEARVKFLASALKEGLGEAIPGVGFHTPISPESSAGVVVFTIPGATHGDVFQQVYESHRLGCAAMGGAFDGIRLSPHLYNGLADVELAVRAMADYA